MEVPFPEADSTFDGFKGMKEMVKVIQFRTTSEDMVGYRKLTNEKKQYKYHTLLRQMRK